MTRRVVFDFETVELLADGSTVASAEYYRKEFRVASCAFTEGDESWFVQGEDNVRAELLKLQDAELIAHNAPFELGVCKCRFPDVPINLTIDTMRLVQVYDNGGKEYEVEYVYDEDNPDEPKAEMIEGLGLAKAARRILKEVDHKAETYAILRDKYGVKKKKEGQNLHLLNDEELRAYNVADTETTWRLYEHCLYEFDRIGYDWTIDHKLYIGAAHRLAEAKIRGIRIDRPSLQKNIDLSKQQMTDIGAKFLTDFAEPIKKVERQLLLERIRKLKTLKGRKKYLKKGRRQKGCTFNVGSNRQLELLFCDVLGIKPFFLSPKGKASFKSSHMYTYGEGGKLLAERRKIQIVLKQSEALMLKSEYDGLYHVDLRLAATRTGRMAGTGGFNMQATARRNKGLMSTFLPIDPNNVFVSQDASAGEPTILTQFTKDPYYKYFCFDGVGKVPFYKDGVLMIDDIYLGYASVCPMFKDELYQVFHHKKFDDRSFAEQWMIDSEVCKNAIKSLRKNAKWVVLGFGYGLGPKTLFKKAIEAGLQVNARTCKQAFDAYWQLFSGIKKYCRDIEAHVAQNSWFQNPWGYRFVPTEIRKSFNGMIQSSVSSMFHWYSDLLAVEAPYARYVSTIHDENLYECPRDRLDDFKAAQARVAKMMNDQLAWDVDVRFGFVSGPSLYEAK